MREFVAQYAGMTIPNGWIKGAGGLLLNVLKLWFFINDQASCRILRASASSQDSKITEYLGENTIC